MKKMKIHFATPVRGFFQHLFRDPQINANITFPKNSLYEINNWKNRLVKTIVRSYFFDKFGIIKSIKVQKIHCDIYGSFNRFLNADKPYFIYVENPTALYHYRLLRAKSYFGKQRIKKEIESPNLKALICMSKACYSTFEQVCSKIPARVTLAQIYPLVPDNNYISTNKIRTRCNADSVKLLFIAQGLRFTSKGALEVLFAYRRLKQNGFNITLTMVTSFKDANQEAIDLVKKDSSIILHDFHFSYEEMQKLYASHTLLVIPTSDDSFNLTVLEAMKAGLPVIGSRLYAIPEMVKEGENGFLCNPAYWFFDQANLPNPSVWNNRKKTIYSGKICEEIVKFLYDKIQLLFNDRSLLMKMSLDSYNKSNFPPFSRDFITNQWNKLFDSMKEKQAF